MQQRVSLKVLLLHPPVIIYILIQEQDNHLPLHRPLPAPYLLPPYPTPIRERVNVGCLKEVPQQTKRQTPGTV